jgi:YYY domain-containing protein
VIDALRWLLVLEVVGLAFLPLSTWLLRSLPDRGYGASKIAGLLGVTYVTWLIGSFVPIVGSPLVPVAVVLATAAIGWIVYAGPTIERLRPMLRVVAVEEAIFLAGYIGWCLLRAFAIHPGIVHTEQPMDMALLNASIHAASYPAYDPWMSGHTINYYYLGYVMYGMLAKLSGVAPAVAYNLALSTVPALLMSACYGLVYALARRLWWSLLAPIFVAVIGNWHAALVQLPHGQTPDNTTWWFWCSSRVIGGCVSTVTITEFPFFSFLLGDLHPHVMALPVAALAVTVGCALAMEGKRIVVTQEAGPLARLVCVAIVAGSIFTINSWDYPIYLVVIAGGIGVNGYLTDGTARWYRAPAMAIGVVVLLSLALFGPFYTHIKSVTKGIGFVTTPSNFWEFMQVLGFFLLLAFFLVTLLSVLLQPADDAAIVDDETEDWLPAPPAASEAGYMKVVNGSNLWVVLTCAAILILALRFHDLVLVVLLGLGLGAASLLYRVLNTEEPNMGDAYALVLVAAGCLAAAIPEVVYLRDVFDGSASYRMNTVFKFDYQAWLLLGLASAYGTYRVWSALSSRVAPILGWATVALAAIGTVMGLGYTWNAPQSASVASLGGAITGLDALQQVKLSAPGDYAMIEWLRAHASPNTTELEAIKTTPPTDTDDYKPEFARIATFTALSAVMGWEAHESQWRGTDPEIASRVTDVNTIYSTSNTGLARSLLKKYGVKYVIVGASERLVYGDKPGALSKFGRFMHVAYSVSNPSEGTKIRDFIYTF